MDMETDLSEDVIYSGWNRSFQLQSSELSELLQQKKPDFLRVSKIQEDLEMMDAKHLARKKLLLTRHLEKDVSVNVMPMAAINLEGEVPATLEETANAPKETVVSPKESAGSPK